MAASHEIPAIAHQTLSRWYRQREPPRIDGDQGEVLLFNDLFTEYQEPQIGIAAVEFLERAGLRIALTQGIESGRIQISQGLLRQAKRRLDQAIERLYPHAAEGKFILGLEPSEILTFRDEAPDLVKSRLREQARAVARQTRLFEEFVAEVRLLKEDQKMFENYTAWSKSRSSFNADLKVTGSAAKKAGWQKDRSRLWDMASQRRGSSTMTTTAWMQKENS